MRCDSIKILSSIPFDYYKNNYYYPEEIIDQYIRLYRKKLTSDIIIEYLLYDGIYRLEDRFNYILKIYQLEEDHIFNLDITPNQIIELYNKSHIVYEFIKMIHQLTGVNDIFEGNDLDQHRHSLIKCRSFQIYQALY